jgi:hypothetical protein
MELLDELVQLQVLKHKASDAWRQPVLVDKLVETQNGTPEMRQMCAKVSPQRMPRWKCCNFLDLSRSAPS